MSEMTDSYLSRTVKSGNAEKYHFTLGDYSRTEWSIERRSVAEIELGYRVVDALIVQLPADWFKNDRGDYFCTTCAESPWAYESSYCGHCGCACTVGTCCTDEDE